MAGPYDPAIKGVEYIFYLPLRSMTTPGSFQVNPTIASGDFKVSKDGGALANLTTLPAVTPAASIWVKITLSATEMDADNVQVQCVDQTATKEWEDSARLIQTQAATTAAVNVTQLNGTSIAGTGSRIADAFVALLNVASPTLTVASVNQTGDSFARIGVAGVGLTAVALTGTQTFNNTGTWTGNIVGTLSTLTTYTGNTVQTGDSFARISTAGAGLTNVPWNASWDAEVQSEVDDALTAWGKTGFALANGSFVTATFGTCDFTATMKTSITTAVPTAAANAAAVEAAILNEGDATALLAAIAAKVEEFLINDGDATATIAAISAAVWSSATRTLTAGTNINGSTFTAVPWNSAWDAEIESEVADGLAAWGKTGFALISDYDPAKTAATQTSVNDLPTNAELATALGTADDAVLVQIALVRAKTDSLTFSIAGSVDTNIKRVNDSALSGSGTSGDPWGPA